MGKKFRSSSPSHKTPSENGDVAPRGVVWRFIALFLCGLAVGGTLFAYLASRNHGFMQTLMEVTAAITGFVVSLFSENAFYAGQICTFQDFTVKIIDECTGVLEMVIYSAAVLAYPTGWRKKMRGILFGIPAIYAFNVVRIILLLVVGAYSRPLFEFMHLYFWQATLIVIIATIWIGWLLLVVYREKDALAVSD